MDSWLTLVLKKQVLKRQAIRDQGIRPAPVIVPTGKPKNGGNKSLMPISKLRSQSGRYGSRKNNPEPAHASAKIKIAIVVNKTANQSITKCRCPRFPPGDGRLQAVLERSLRCPFQDFSCPVYGHNRCRNINGPTLFPIDLELGIEQIFDCANDF